MVVSSSKPPTRPGTDAPRAPLPSVSESIGRVELFDEIGSGGMATVHIGRLIGAGGFCRIVAVKRPHPQFARDENFVAMFLDEARLVARIRHPNVLPTIDLIERQGELFIVMEYIEGASFAELLERARRLKQRVPLGVALRIVCGALHGLHAAHDARGRRGEPLGLVHRDVSPQNILVGVDGFARIHDFGVARALSNAHSTAEGQVKGKLSYIAPEQLMGNPVDRRADVFSASVVLWQALTGKRLFKGIHVGEISHNVLNKAIDAPSYVIPDLPKKLDPIVLRGLMREPDERWSSALEMAQALEAVGDLASQQDVGAWVRSVAGDRLQELARKVELVDAAPLVVPELDEERASSVVERTPARRARESKGAPKNSVERDAEDPPTETSPDLSPRTATRRLAVPLAALALVVVAAAILLSQRSSPSATIHAPFLAQLVSSLEPPSASSTLAHTATAAPTERASGEPSATAPAAPSSPPQSGPRKGVATPKPAAKPASSLYVRD